MATPTLNGAAAFGAAVRMVHVPNANASMIAAFFGVQGVQSLDGGTRGRVFMVEGLMTGSNPPGVVANELALQSFANGGVYLLVDTTGIAWANVQFRNEFQPGDKFMWSPTLFAWCRPYRAVLHGLT